MRRFDMMKSAVFAVAVWLFIGSSVTFAQVAPSLNPNPAILVEPANLAEAAGQYVAAADYLHYLKGTSCGYALVRDAPNFETVVRDEVVGYFPASQRKEILDALMALKNDSAVQARSMFEGFYNYYTKTEKLDGKTACGFIVGSAISIRKMAAEQLLHKSAQR